MRKAAVPASLAAVAMASSTFGAVVVDQGNTITNTAYTIANLGPSGGIVYRAQSFTAGLTGDLVGVTLDLSKTAGATSATLGSLVVQITTLGNKFVAAWPNAGNVLASTTLAPDAVGTAPSYVEIDFPTPLHITAGEQLAVRITLPTVSTDRYTLQGLGTFDNYSGGSAYAMTQTTNDVYQTIQYDYGFQTLVSVPEPTTAGVLATAGTAALRRRRKA